LREVKNKGIFEFYVEVENAVNAIIKGELFETYNICTGTCGLTGRSGKYHKPFLPKTNRHNSSGGYYHES